MRRGFQQQVYECPRLVAALEVAGVLHEAKQFLELIHENEKAAAGRHRGPVGKLQQTQRTPPQGLLDGRAHVDRRGFRRAEHILSAERGGQGGDRIFAGPHDGDAPAVRVRRHETGTEGREKTGSHQRRLSSSRASEDRHEAISSQPVEQLVNPIVAAEEQLGFVRLEWPDTRKRVVRQGETGRRARRRHDSPAPGGTPSGSPHRNRAAPGLS